MAQEIRREKARVKCFCDLLGIYVNEAGISEFVNTPDELNRILEHCNSEGEYSFSSRHGIVAYIQYIAPEEFLSPGTKLSFEEFRELGKPKRICKETSIEQVISPVD